MTVDASDVGRWWWAGCGRERERISGQVIAFGVAHQALGREAMERKPRC